MKPIAVLPANYQPHHTLDFSTRPMFIRAFDAVLITFILTIISTLAIVTAFRPGFSQWVISNGLTIYGSSIVAISMTLVIGLLLMIWIHEIIYGTCLWLMRVPTRQIMHRIFFTVQPLGCYIPRTSYLLARTAPMFLVTFVGITLLLVVPLALITTMISLIILGLAVSAVDLLIISWSLCQPGNTLVHDDGKYISSFAPR